jgi:polyhydroxyalkanoate synthesis regulator phasin
LAASSHFKESLQGAIQLADNQKPLEDIVQILHGILLMMAKVNTECSFLIDHLMQKGLFTADEIKQLLEAVAEKMKPDEVDSKKAETERLLDLLRKFEGPPQ